MKSLVDLGTLKGTGDLASVCNRSELIFLKLVHILHARYKSFIPVLGSVFLGEEICAVFLGQFIQPKA